MNTLIVAVCVMVGLQLTTAIFDNVQRHRQQSNHRGSSFVLGSRPERRRPSPMIAERYAMRGRSPYVAGRVPPTRIGTLRNGFDQRYEPSHRYQNLFRNNPLFRPTVSPAALNRPQRYRPQNDDTSNLRRQHDRHGGLPQRGNFKRGSSMTDRRRVPNEPPRKYRPVYANPRDPCYHRPEGDYALTDDFRPLFSVAIDRRCSFVKCANFLTHVNPCGPGSRNDDSGRGFCSQRDTQSVCGDPHARRSNDQRPPLSAL